MLTEKEKALKGIIVSQLGRYTLVKCVQHSDLMTRTTNRAILKRLEKLGHLDLKCSLR